MAVFVLLDQALIKEFHRDDWARRLELTSKFADARVRTPDAATHLLLGSGRAACQKKGRYARAIAARLRTRTEMTGRWTTLDDAIKEADKRMLEAAEDSKPFVQGHPDRLKIWSAEADAQLTP